MDFSIFLPETSVSSSRIVQESINVGQGVSTYGILASFIDTNIAKIDQIAEYISDNVAQNMVKMTYDKQHFTPNSKYKTFVTRNIYLNKDKIKSMEDERMICGFIARTSAEAAIKYGARSLGKWLNKKDVFITCEQIYSILVDYVNNAKPGANFKKAKMELNKIRNSFPISITDKRKLAEKYNSHSNISEALDVSSIINNNNETLKNTLAYFISVLRRQLYGTDSDTDKSLLDYYSLIDINGKYGKELSMENEYNYDCIAADQVAYLQLSRGIMRNMFNDSPNINLEIISARAAELAQYDPYAVRRKKIKGAAKGGALSIGGIILNNPDIALSGLSTAIAQFSKTDELMQLSKNTMQKWGISGNEFDAISEDADSIIRKNQENDLNHII